MSVFHIKIIVGEQIYSDDIIEMFIEKYTVCFVSFLADKLPSK